MATLTLEYCKIRKDGSRTMRMLIRNGSSRYYVPLSISLEKNEYKVYADGRVRITNDNKYFMVEDTLASVRTGMTKALTMLAGQKVSAEELYILATKPTSSKEINEDFFTFSERWLASSTIKGNKNYYTMLNNLSRFLGKRYLPLKNINYNLLNNYMLSLRDRPRAQSLYLGAIRHIYKMACLEYNDDNNNILSTSVFDRFKVPKQMMIGQRALSFEELKAFINYTPTTKREVLAKDCCMLSFALMGTNSVDLYEMTDYNKGIIAYDRTKTKDRRYDNAHIEIEVPDEIMDVFKTYHDSDNVRVFDFYKRYSDAGTFNSAINKGLKSIAGHLWMDSLQFYQFRHTWASICRNELEIDRGTVDEALNHKSSENGLLDVYVKKSYKAINKANKKVVRWVWEHAGLQK